MKHRGAIVAGTVLVLALGFGMKSFLSYIRSTEVTGMLQANKAYALSNAPRAKHLYGKYYFVTDDGRWLAVRDHELSEIFDVSGTSLFRRGTDYSLRSGKKLRARGVIHDIGVFQFGLAAKGKEDQLEYPHGADGLFDIRRIQWIE